jgi:predicted RNA binding protein YcfA (HicA-like mRNA interferase family)
MPRSFRQAERELKEAGFVHTRTGTHRIFVHSEFGLRVALGYHGSNRELRPNEEREVRFALEEVRRLTGEPER